MKMIEFEWDENKNRINIEKHGISFDEASTVFYDDYAILFDDPDHSDEIIRIISARKATKQETKTYNSYRKGWENERGIWY